MYLCTNFHSGILLKYFLVYFCIIIYTGAELLVYANVWHNTRNSEQAFSPALLAWWCGLTERSVHAVLKRLVQKGCLMTQRRSDGALLLRAVHPAVCFPVCSPVGSEACSETEEKEKKQKKKEKRDNTTADSECRTAAPPSPPAHSAFPDWEEFWQYCLRKQISEDMAKRFFTFYEANGWRDKNGRSIAKWKAKLAYWLQTEHASPTAPRASVQSEKDTDYIRRKKEREAAEAEAYARRQEQLRLQHNDSELRAQREEFFRKHGKTPPSLT